MTLFHIFIISVVQGLTEFLPISSSGHLVLVPAFLGLPDQGLIMDLAAHIGSLLAVLVYYRRDVWKISLACLHWNATEDKQSRNLGVFIVLATIPAVIAGFVMHKIIPDGIRDVRVITATTIFFAILMGLADRFGAKDRALNGMTLKSAAVVGFAQMIALIPGTSRSGITITAGRFLGFNRVDAARFSFLLSIPATAGAGMLGMLDVIESGNTALGIDMLLAIVMTFFAALAAISFMMRWLKNFGLMPFVIYRIFLGAILIMFFN